MPFVNNLEFEHANAVTKSDTVANIGRALWVGGTGDVKLTTKAGDVVTLTAVPAGTLLHISHILVWSAGTTATNMVNLL